MTQLLKQINDNEKKRMIQKLRDSNTWDIPSKCNVLKNPGMSNDKNVPLNQSPQGKLMGAGTLYINEIVTMG